MNVVQEKVLDVIARVRAQVNSGNRWAVYGVPLVFLGVVFFALYVIVLLSNANGGFIAAASIVLSVPLAIIASDKLEQRRLTRKVGISLHIIAHELWVNLNYVWQINLSYLKNIDRIESAINTDEIDGKCGEIGIPHFGPRTAVIEKIIDSEHIFNLNNPLPIVFVEVYAQLVELSGEFLRWKNMHTNMNFNCVDTYIVCSSTLLGIVNPLMRNMMKLWVPVVSEVGIHSSYRQIVSVANIINNFSGCNVFIEFMSSSCVDLKTDDMESVVIICWVDDWAECPFKTVELHSVADLYGS